MTDYEKFNELFHYDPHTGEMRRKVTISSRAQAGMVARVHKGDGYIRVMVNRKNYFAHRIAWLLTHKEWPEFIDHIDGNGLNNKLTNLRNVTKSLNAQNQRKAMSSNKSSGLLGVSRTRHGNWRAHIQTFGVTAHLGTFNTPEEAHHAYLSAKREHHAGCTI